MHASLKHLLAAGALLAGVVACDLEPEQAPPFSPTGTGRAIGQVFFDADGNGVFDPVSGDDLLADATVTISERGDSSRVLATTTTDANGEFSFASIPVGTHELRARTAGGVRYTCSPIPVTIYVAEPAFTLAPARLSCRIDIAEAKARTSGTIVTVAGIVTAQPGVYFPDNLYLTDRSGGMLVSFLPGGSNVAEGDSVEITGTLGQTGGELRLAGTPSLRVITRNVRTPAPTPVTAASVKAAFAAGGTSARPIGELVKFSAAKVRGFPATPGSSGTNGWLVQQADSVQLRLDRNAGSAIPLSTFDPQKCYDVVGILGYFTPNPQIKPRRLSDIMEVACPTR